jgi:hypothetical protein
MEYQLSSLNKNEDHSPSCQAHVWVLCGLYTAGHINTLYGTVAARRWNCSDPSGGVPIDASSCAYSPCVSSWRDVAPRSLPLCLIMAAAHRRRPSLWSSGQSSWLQIQRSRVPFPELPDFLKSSGSGSECTGPHKENWGVTWKKSSGSGLEKWN